MTNHGGCPYKYVGYGDLPAATVQRFWNMCGHNYAKLLEADALLPLSFFFSLSLLSLFLTCPFINASFNKLREVVNHLKAEATNRCI